MLSRTRRGINSHIRWGQIRDMKHTSTGHTKTEKGEYRNVVPEHCIVHNTFESISSIYQAYNLNQQAF